MITDINYAIMSCIEILSREWVAPLFINVIAKYGISGGVMSKRKIRVVDLVADQFDKLPKEQFEQFELVDVAFVKEGRHRYLRVYIDKDGGVTIDDCADVSKALNDMLDKYDPVEENYILEVSSPGVERPLKKAEHFIRFKGKLAQIKLYFPIDGTKLIEGNIVDYRDGNVIIKSSDTAKLVEIPFDKIAAAKLLFEFGHSY